MKSEWISFWLLLAVSALVGVGCATRMKIMSIPDGATVSIYGDPEGLWKWQLRDKVESSTIYAVKTPADFFGSAPSPHVNLLFSKEGYATVSRVMPLVKGTVNPVITQSGSGDDAVVRLPPINTALSIATEPQGARLTFYRSEADARAGVSPVLMPVGARVDLANLPNGDLSVVDNAVLNQRTASKTTPWRLECPDVFVKDKDNQALREIRFVRAELDDYLVAIRPFSIEPAVNASLEIKLKPAIITLNIKSSPVGVVVEDVSPGGFGRLGQTDFNMQITYQQLRSRVKFIGENERLVLDLRAFKEGYAERNWNIEVPLGDKYEIEFHLGEALKSVRFDSEPAGASVYVKRNIASGDRDDKTKQMTDFKKHLGMTPFTYNITAEDPLRHAEIIFFEKAGYKSTEVSYAKGQLVVHGKLDPIVAEER